MKPSTLLNFSKCTLMPALVILGMAGCFVWWATATTQHPLPPLKAGNKGVTVMRIQQMPEKKESTPDAVPVTEVPPPEKLKKVSPKKPTQAMQEETGAGLPEEEVFNIEKLPKLEDAPLFAKEAQPAVPDTVSAGIPNIPDESMWPPLKPWETLIAYLVDSKGVVIDAIVLKSSGRNILDETLLAKGSMTMTLYSEIDPPIPEGEYQWFLEKYTIGKNAILP